MSGYKSLCHWCRLLLVSSQWIPASALCWPSTVQQRSRAGQVQRAFSMGARQLARAVATFLPFLRTCGCKTALVPFAHVCVCVCMCFGLSVGEARVRHVWDFPGLLIQKPSLRV